MSTRWTIKPIQGERVLSAVAGLVALAIAVPSPSSAADPRADEAWGLYRTLQSFERRSQEPAFMTDGTLVRVEQRASAESPIRGARTEFIPNVRVDDGINSEHREPAVAWGPGGAPYAIYCERATHWNPELAMFTQSTDGGATWLAPAVPINDTSPNAVIFPAVDVMADGTIVVVWCELMFAPYNYEVRFSRSSDGGNTWSPSSVIHPIDPSKDYARPSILVVGDRILVSFWQIVSYPASYPILVYSDDGGDTWSGPAVITSTFCTSDGAAACLAYNEGLGEVGVVMRTASSQIIFCHSSDSGETWSDPVQVNDVAAGSVNYPDLDCGGGFFHVVWYDNRNGQTDCDIFTSRSADGETFTPSVRVNDSFGGNQYESHIRVGSDGRIHVCWIWNIPFGFDIDLYYAFSDDGGDTWLHPCPRVNDIPYVVQPYVAWTSDLLADGEGNTFVFWNDGRTTDYYDNIYFSTTRVPTAVEATSGASFPSAALLPNVPNPFNPTTRIRFCLPEAGPVLLAVHDVNGRRVTVLVSGYHEAGEFERTWDGRDGTGQELASGVYFAYMQAGHFVAKRKMVLLK